MPLVTFFSVLELPEKNRKGGCNKPPLVRRGLINSTVQQMNMLKRTLSIIIYKSIISWKIIV